MTSSPVPVGTPLINPGAFEVPVRILFDQRGALLIESPAHIQAKYQDLRDDLEITMVSETHEARTTRKAQLAAAEKQETELFALVEQQRGGEVQPYTFQFRVATLEDSECAEAEAAKTQPRQELVYRRTLAQKTLLETDFPDFRDFGKLRTDIALFVLREVGSRVLMSSEVRDFLHRPEGV